MLASTTHRPSPCCAGQLPGRTLPVVDGTKALSSSRPLSTRWTSAASSSSVVLLQIGSSTPSSAPPAPSTSHLTATSSQPWHPAAALHAFPSDVIHSPTCRRGSAAVARLPEPWRLSRAGSYGGFSHRQQRPSLPSRGAAAQAAAAARG